MIDRELYLPESWTDDPAAMPRRARARAGRVPDEAGACPGHAGGALDAGVPAVGAPVHGSLEAAPASAARFAEIAPAEQFRVPIPGTRKTARALGRPGRFVHS
jgi:hypothetical protein